MPTNPVSLALAASEYLDRLKNAMIYGTSHPEMYVTESADKMTDSNRLTNMVGRLRAYAIVCKQADFNEAADAIEELMAALKDLIEDHEHLTGRGPDEDNWARGNARAAYLGEKNE